MPARHAPARRLLLLTAALAAAALLLVGGARAEAAATITVDILEPGTATDGKCSLAEALQAAETDAAFGGCTAGSGDDTINISKGGEIESTGSFKIESNVTIQGHSGGSTVRGVPFQVVLKDGGSSGSGSVPKVTLADLTITGAGDVGVLIDDKTTAVGSDTDYSVVLENLKVSGYNFGVRFLKRSDSAHPGSVEIKSSVVTGNRYWGVDWWDGSGAESVGVSLTVANSELRENSEGNHGGGGLRSMNGHVKIFNSLIGDNKGYGVYADRERSDTSDTEIVNTTIDGNRSDGNGNDGGVHVRGSGTLKIDNSTITRNGQGGVYADSPADVSVSITNTVIAKNTDVQCSSGLTLTVNEGNASSDASCGFTLADKGIASGLGELADNGGAAPLGPNGGERNVRTRAVGPASRLLDAGDASTCQATDARGVSRPQPEGSGCDIGAYEAIVVGGVVWEDNDGDLTKDTGEQVFEGVTVELARRGDATDAVQTVETNADGAYKFDASRGGFDASRGGWVVSVTELGDNIPSGHVAIPGSAAEFTVTNDGATGTVFDFGYAAPVEIRVRVWEDNDGDGLFGEDELGLARVGLELARRGDPVRTVVTDRDGVYSHTGPPGEWTVTVTGGGGVPSGYVLDAGDTLTREVVGADGVSDFDFGYQPDIRIGGHVWEDKNGDGRRDADEGLDGVTLELLKGRGDEAVRVNQTATTGPDGAYRFDDLVSAGRWTVEVTDTRGALAAYDGAKGTRLTLGVSRSGGNASVFDFDFTAAD